MCRADVSHIDMNATNYAGSPEGEIHPVDFGDPVVRSPLGAGAADLRRYLFGRCGLVQRLAKRTFHRVCPNSQRLYRSFKLRFSSEAGIVLLAGTQPQVSGWPTHR